MNEPLRYSVQTRGGRVTETVYLKSGGLSIHGRVQSAAGAVFPFAAMHTVRDYGAGLRTLTSAYVALDAVAGRPKGAVTKTAWSRQEQNGASYAEAVFTADSVTGVWFAPDRAETHAAARLSARNGVAEEALPLWAMRVAYPFLARGRTFRAQILAALSTGKFDVEDGQLTLQDQPQVVLVPAGSFTANVFKVAAGGRWWHYFVERPEPNRILRWESWRQERGELLG